MTAAANLAIVADRPATHLSPARQALAEHHASIGELKAAVARASRPVEQLREQVRVANEPLAAAEAELAGVEAAHSAAIAKAAREGSTAPLPKAPVREKLLEHIEEAKRNKAAVERALAECVGELTTATAAVREAEGKVGPLMLAVLLAEHPGGVNRWQRACDVLISAEAELKGLLNAISAHGRELEAKGAGDGIVWLQAWERLSSEWAKISTRELAPADIFAAAARWSAMLDQLASDPSAAVSVIANS